MFQVADINPDGDAFRYDFYRGAYAMFKEELFFSAIGPNGHELFRTDGTSVTEVADINPNGDSIPSHLHVFDEQLFFVARGPVGFELYRTDGVTTHLVTDINSDEHSHEGDSFLSPHARDFSGERFFAELNGELFFPAYDSDDYGLYKYTPIPEPSTLLITLVALFWLLTHRPRPGVWRPQ